MSLQVAPPISGFVPQQLAAGRRILVCLGSGGVGKTTLAVALGIAAALQGKKTLVMSVDPARRLMQALGLPDLGTQAQRVDNDVWQRQGLGAVTQQGGYVDVLMPEVQQTFDALLERCAPHPQAAKVIRENPLYQHFARALAGSHEYAAMEKLYEVVTAATYEQIIVDTPPAQHAMSFLQAPQRILDFLESDALVWLRQRHADGRAWGGRWLDVAGNLLFKGLSQVAGGETLTALGQLLGDFSSMYQGFAQRARYVQNLFGAAELGFIWIGAAQPQALLQVQTLRQALQAEGWDLRGAVVNRVTQPLLALTPAAQALWQHAVAQLTPAAQQQLQSALRAEAARRQQNATVLQRLQQQLQPLPCVHTADLGPQPQLGALVSSLI